ncbi:Coiled-coil domain-containing protein 50 N-terminus [Popillia japonica]|uniref:Coiled-coil domain-containing protein 50 N-terminus n=1 Tax=Popillia japonica TaxID=7064 RepID=A0AAW1IT32_POPJA
MDLPDNNNNNDNSEIQAETVRDTRLKWMITADKALAEQMQSKEIKEHYQKNKQRNAQLRKDLSRAKTMAEEFEERRILQIEVDRKLASELSKELENGLKIEALLQQRRDEELARNLQQLEMDKLGSINNTKK